MSRGKLTELQRGYNKQFKTVIGRIEKLESEGYSFPERLIPKKLTRPQTKSLENLKKLTESELKKQHSVTYTYVDKQGKEHTVSGREGAKLQKSESAKKGWKRRRERESINTPPIYDYGEALLTNLKNSLEEGMHSDDSAIRKRSNSLYDFVEEQERNNYTNLINNLVENQAVIASLLSEVLKYHYNAEGNYNAETALTELEGILRGSTLSMHESAERQSEWEEDFDEELPFY